jgi:2-methylcitrate dehydratase
VGHRRRRAEGIPLLERKFMANLRTRFPEPRCQEIMELCLDQSRLEAAPVTDFVGMFAVS